MLRPFLKVAALTAGMILVPSCKKAGSDDGGTRSDGKPGLSEPTSIEAFQRARDLFRVGLNIASPTLPAYASPLILKYTLGGEQKACLLTKDLDNSPVLRMSKKCSFDSSVKEATVRFQNEEKPGMPAATAPLVVAAAIVAPPKCGGENVFTAFNDKVMFDKFSGPVKNLLDGGGQAYLNNATGALLLLVKDEKYLAPGLEACSSAASNLTAATIASYTAEWQAVANHVTQSADMFVNAKNDFYKKHFVGYVANRNKSPDDPFIRPEAAKEAGFPNLAPVLSRFMHSAVPARAAFYPIAYPIVGAETSCVGYAVELIKVQPGDATSIVLRGANVTAFEDKWVYDVNDWDVAVAMGSTGNQRKFAHTLFAVGVFSDQNDADVVLALSPAVRTATVPTDPMVTEVRKLYDCALDSVESSCEVMQPPPGYVPGPTCPRLTAL